MYSLVNLHVVLLRKIFAADVAWVAERMGRPHLLYLKARERFMLKQPEGLFKSMFLVDVYLQSLPPRVALDAVLIVALVPRRLALGWPVELLYALLSSLDIHYYYDILCKCRL